MGLDTTIRKLVQGTAYRVTRSLHTTIIHEPWIGFIIVNGRNTGKARYGTAIAREAIVEYTDEVSRRSAGEELRSRAKLTILRPISSNGAEGRQEPLDPRDRITLPDGTSGPILSINGVVDPKTNEPYMYEVVLGA